MIEPGDVVTALLPGANETKRRPAVVVSSERYQQERPDVLLAIITSRTSDASTTFDYLIVDWQDAGLKLPSATRSFLFSKPQREVRQIGRLTPSDWIEVQKRLKLALDLD